MKFPSKSSQKGPALSQSNGFTLIELLVVISIIAVLVGFLLTNMVGIRGRAADTRKKSDLRQLKAALRLYYNDNQHYPDPSDVPASGTFADNGNVYMKELPQDFTYQSNADETFLLVTPLENASDEDAAKSQARCASEITEYGAVQATDYVVCQD